MNVEILIDVLTYVQRVNKERNVLNKLGEVKAALQKSINEPSDSTSEEFKAKYSELIKILDSDPLNNTFPSYRATIIDIGGEKYIGIGLRNVIINMFDNNNLTPNIALNELEKISERVNVFHTKINTVLDNLNQFNFGGTGIDPNSFQILTTIPKKQIPQTLEAVKKEFDLLDKLLRTLSEVADGRGESPKLRIISASEWQVMADLLPASSVLLIIAIEKITQIFATLWNLKNSKETLETNDAPREIIDQLSDHIEKKVSEAIDQLSNELIEEHCVVEDVDRKNELKVSLKLRLKHLAQRLDNGTKFEVHASIQSKPAEPEKPKAVEKTEDISDEEFKKLQEEYTKKLEIYNKNKEQYEKNISEINDTNEKIKLIRQKSRRIDSAQEAQRESLQLQFDSEDEEEQIENQ